MIMKKIKLTQKFLYNSVRGMLSAVAVTIPMWLIGRDVLGEAVISLLYLAPIAWSANKWGPYRFIRHPNYALVIVEIALLPLLMGAPAMAPSMAMKKMISWCARSSSMPARRAMKSAAAAS